MFKFVQNFYLLFTTPEDLRHFGMIPEFIGRLPIITYVNNLTTDNLITILTKPKNSITKQYQKLLEMDNKVLEFKKDALKEIANIAIALKTGARGLKSIMEDVMLDVMYNAPENEKNKILVTKQMVISKLKSKYKT